MPDERQYALSNSDLSIVVIPSEGGRVASLRSLSSGLEFLTQSCRRGVFHPVGLHAAFKDGPCAGIEECLPSVGPCGDDTEEGPVPDHGDLWQLAWDVDDASSAQLRLHSSVFSRPLLVSKVLSLSGRCLRIAYEVKNVGQHETSFLYACHPLFAVSEGDHICLPAEVSYLSLDYSRNYRLGPVGKRVSWPLAQPGIALDVALSCKAGTAEMLYSDPLHEGCCGLYRNSAQQGLQMRFDASTLPFLGVWLCYGGWPENSVGPMQNAVALEPTFAPVNTLKEAQAAGMARRLLPDESIRWEIEFQITNPGISLERFRAEMESLPGGDIQ